MPHTSLDSFVNASVKRPINSLLIGNLTFCKYDVAVLWRVISIFEMILLAVGWVVEVVVLCRQYIDKMIANVSDWLSYTGGALIKVDDSAGSTVALNILHYV